MGVVLLIKLPHYLARLHHSSAVQAILAAELFLLFILGGEVGDDAFVRRADLFLATEAVKVPLLAGTRRRAVLAGVTPGYQGCKALISPRFFIGAGMGSRTPTSLGNET